MYEYCLSADFENGQLRIGTNIKGQKTYIEKLGEKIEEYNNQDEDSWCVYNLPIETFRKPFGGRNTQKIGVCDITFERGKKEAFVYTDSPTVMRHLRKHKDECITFVDDESFIECSINKKFFKTPTRKREMSDEQKEKLLTALQKGKE